MSWIKDQLEDQMNKKVVTNWDDQSGCIFAEKKWVNPKNVNVQKEYLKGDFPRVWCLHESDWCEAKDGDCQIRTDHENE